MSPEKSAREQFSIPILQTALDSLEEYGSKAMHDKHDKLEHKPAYIIGTPKQRLVFCGVKHTHDSQNPTIQIIKEQLDRALKETTINDITFLIEGHHGDISQNTLYEFAKALTSQEEAIEKYGEGGFILWKVKELIEQGYTPSLLSPEKHNQDIQKTLLEKGLSLESISAYLAIRELCAIIVQKDHHTNMLTDIMRKLYDEIVMNDYMWTGPMPTPEEFQELQIEDVAGYEEAIRTYINRYLSGLSAFLKQQGIDLFLDYETLVHIQPHDTLHARLSHIIDPLDGKSLQTSINVASAQWNQERDRFLIEVIAKEMTNNRIPFIVFGASHAISTEPALACLIKHFAPTGIDK